MLSLAMVEAAIRSAGEGRRVAIAEVLDDAYAQAVAAERGPGDPGGAGRLDLGAGRRRSEPPPRAADSPWTGPEGVR